MSRPGFWSRPSAAVRLCCAATFRVEELEPRAVPAVSQLPDLTVWADPGRGYMYDWQLDTTTMSGRTLLRMSNAVANVGTGRLEIRGGPVVGPGTQVVYQRIYDDASGWTEREAGRFIYHDAHSHIHFEDFAQYNLRAVTAGDGVGAIVATGAKTSFCLEDTAVYNSSLPGAPSSRGYYGCGQVQGISVGWADVYRRNLSGQWIDITGVPNGTYWLESVADPLNRIAESNEANNVTRIKITIGGAGAPDYAGNTIATARDVGELSANQTFRDAVSSADTNDYYRFTVSSPATFTLRMDEMQADADVQLLTSSGQLLARSIRGGTQAEAISRSLSSGTYIVRVYPYGGANTSYTLNLAAGVEAADGAGNTLGEARDIGELSGTQTFRDAVSAADPNDYYRFRVTGTSDVQFSLQMNGLTGNADVELLDESGAVLSRSANGGTTAETIQQVLHPGAAYFIRVFPRDGAGGNYALSISGVPMTGADGAGNTLAAARDLGALSGSQTHQDWVGPEDSNDYYRFTVTRSGTFSLRLDGMSADADVQLLSSTGGVVASSFNGSATAESITRTLAAGTYYIRVYPYGGARTNYRLVVNFV